MKHRFAWAPAALMLAMSTAAWPASFAARQEALPAGSVLKVRLDDTLRSDRNQRGDRFTATVTGQGDGYDLPSGTRVEGVVSDVQRANSKRPGMLDVTFRDLRLPDGQTYQIAGSPISLDSQSVERSSDGRLVARSTTKNNKMKFLAYGAGAGFLLGTITKGNRLTDTLLGAAAGYLYGQYDKKKANGHEVVLKPGTEFGVKLDQQVALASTYPDRYQGRVSGYRSPVPSRGGSSTYSRTNPVPYRSGSTTYSGYNGGRYPSYNQYGQNGSVQVLMNNQPVRFTAAQPFRSGSHLMVPLPAVMDAAGVDFQYDRQGRVATLHGPHDVSLSAGSSVALVDGRRVSLSEPARLINDTLYVPSDFFQSALDMQSRWDERSGILTLGGNR